MCVCVCARCRWCVWAPLPNWRRCVVSKSPISTERGESLTGLWDPPAGENVLCCPLVCLHRPHIYWERSRGTRVVFKAKWICVLQLWCPYSNSISLLEVGQPCIYDEGIIKRCPVILHRRWNNHGEAFAEYYEVRGYINKLQCVFLI